VIVLYLLVAAAMAPGMLRLRIDDSPERFFVQDARALERFRLLELHFARDRGVRIVLSGPRLWTHDGLAFAGALERRSQELHGVIGSAGIYRHHHWRFPDWPPADVQAFRRELVDDPVDQSTGWVSPDGTTLTIVAGLYRLSPEERHSTLAELEALDAQAPPGVEVRVVGLATMDRALDESLRRMAVRVFPALLAVAVLLLAAVFRDASGVLLPLVLVAVCQSVVLGAMGYAGQSLDLIVIILVPLLFVIVLATAIHVLCFYRRLRRDGQGPAEAVQATYRVKTWPVIWTGATTAIGFGSLAVSGVPAVRALGLWSAFGMTFATLAMLTLFPALLATTAQPRAAASPGQWRGRFEERSGAFGRTLATAAIEHPITVAIVFGAVGVLALAGLTRLRIESDVISCLPADAPARRDLARLEAHGIGAMAASLVLHGDGLDGPEALRRQSALAETLRDDPLVFDALASGDLVANVGKYVDPSEASGTDRLAAGRTQIARIPDLERMLGYLVASDGHWARITLMLPARGAEVLEPFFDRARTAARAAFPEAESWITGQYPLVLAGQRTLLRTMVLSLAMTALAVAAIFRLVLGSVSLTWRALVPNLWPVLLVLGAMGWLGVPVESATVAIASVVLGLAVDDTFHTLGSFRRLAGTLPADRAAVAALGETAGAHGLTSVTLALGFAVCGFSELVPVARFGALSAFAILAALVADLLLVPLLLAHAPAAALARLAGRR